MNGLFKEWRFWLPIAIIAIGAWTTVQFKAGAALTREEAYKTFWTIVNQDKYDAIVVKRLDKMDEKLDRLLERSAR